jgi:hypothetical protein
VLPDRHGLVVCLPEQTTQANPAAVGTFVVECELEGEAPVAVCCQRSGGGKVVRAGCFERFSSVRTDEFGRRSLLAFGGIVALPRR